MATSKRKRSRTSSQRVSPSVQVSPGPARGQGRITRSKCISGQKQNFVSAKPAGIPSKAVQRLTTKRTTSTSKQIPKPNVSPGELQREDEGSSDLSSCRSDSMTEPEAENPVEVVSRRDEVKKHSTLTTEKDGTTGPSNESFTVRRTRSMSTSERKKEADAGKLLMLPGDRPGQTVSPQTSGATERNLQRLPTQGTGFHKGADALSERRPLTDEEKSEAATGQALQGRRRRPIGARELQSILGPGPSASEMKSNPLRHQPLSGPHEHDDENAAQPASHDIARVGSQSLQAQEPGLSIVSHEPSTAPTGDVASLQEQAEDLDYREATPEEISLIQYYPPGSGGAPRQVFEDVEMDDAASEDSINKFHHSPPLSSLIPIGPPTIQYPAYPDMMGTQFQPPGSFPLYGQPVFLQTVAFPENPYLPSSPSNLGAQDPDASPGTMVRAKNRVPHVRRALNTACEACRKARRRCVHETTPKSVSPASTPQTEQQPPTSQPNFASPEHSDQRSRAGMSVSMDQYQSRDVIQEVSARTTGPPSEPLGDGHPQGALGTYTTFQVQQDSVPKDSRTERIPVLDSVIDPMLDHDIYRTPIDERSNEKSVIENTEDVTMIDGGEVREPISASNISQAARPTPESLSVDDAQLEAIVTSQDKEDTASELFKHRKLLPRPTESALDEAPSLTPADAAPPQRKRPRKSDTTRKDTSSRAIKPAFESFDAALANIQNLVHQEAFSSPSVRAAPKSPIVVSQKDKSESVVSVARSASRASTVTPSNNNSNAKSPSTASSAVIPKTSSTPIPLPSSIRGIGAGPTASDSQFPMSSSPVQPHAKEPLMQKPVQLTNTNLTPNTPSTPNGQTIPASLISTTSTPKLGVKVETDLRSALSNAPAFHPKIGNAGKLLMYLDSQDLEYAQASESQIRGFVSYQLRATFTTIEGDVSGCLGYIGLLVGISFAYTYVERIMHALETWTQVESSPSIQNWAGKLHDIVKSKAVNYVGMKTDEYLPDRLLPGLIPLALPSVALYYWACFADSRDLTIDVLVQKPEFIMMYLDEEMTAVAYEGFRSSIRRMRETMADALSEEDFWATHLIERVWADLATEKQPLCDTRGNAVTGPFGRKEIEDWLESFRSTREEIAEVVQ